MNKTIYHGSKTIIEKPKFNFGKRYNDFGLGFYTTEHIDLANEWAVNDGSNGVINTYTLSLDNLSILNLNDSYFSILNWLAILLENRYFTLQGEISIDGREYIINNFSLPYDTYDVIIGYRADNTFFSYAQDFLNNTISLRKLKESINVGKDGEQIVIKSEKAFDSLSFIDSEEVLKDEWYCKKIERETASIEDYYSHKIKLTKDDIFIVDILNKEMKNEDILLQ